MKETERERYCKVVSSDSFTHGWKYLPTLTSGGREREGEISCKVVNEEAFVLVQIFTQEEREGERETDVLFGIKGRSLCNNLSSYFLLRYLPTPGPNSSEHFLLS